MPAPAISDWPDAEAFPALRREGRAASAHLRLSMQQRTWRGSIGNWAGAGIGSSIDFQDHRPYVPGDDPRHIDWAAYARSGNYIMKLYREEVSPRVDLILDVSRSMLWEEAKRNRLLELACFCAESAAATGSSLRLHTVCGEAAHLFSPDTLAREFWPPPPIESAPGPPRLERLHLQNGSLRIFLSDLLYDTPPAGLLRILAGGKGRVTVLAPYLRLEEQPDWHGNLELIDCESGFRRRQRVDTGLLEKYRAAYRRHLEQWEDTARRYAVLLARVPCEPALLNSLQGEPFAKGAVEPWA
ncbi:MAG: DUF58 domain-containing protein [Verrucomicrobia bacterium]|nr:DUF58 domain-containing protein [Verrucomicrobiota bacterium]MCH8528752.1 DUF58 domain-containing protein [Kiritimatiellia bacterium]